MQKVAPHRMDDESGFTLIELLIVIVVLGILAGIAILGVSAFSDDAKSACKSANKRIDITATAAASAKGGTAAPGDYVGTAANC